MGPRGCQVGRNTNTLLYAIGVVLDIRTPKVSDGQLVRSLMGGCLYLCNDRTCVLSRDNLDWKSAASTESMRSPTADVFVSIHAA